MDRTFTAPVAADPAVLGRHAHIGRGGRSAAVTADHDVTAVLPPAGGHRFGAISVSDRSTAAPPPRRHDERSIPLAGIALDPARRGHLQSILLEGMGAGESLAPDARDRAQRVSPRPLPDVRIHQDELTKRNVDLLDSAALTIGSDVLVGSAADRGARTWLLGHELAHVLQQQPRPSGDTGSIADSGSSDLQADRFADAFLMGDPGHVHRADELSPAPLSIAQKVIWKYVKDLPGDLLLIIDVDDGDFVGGCVRQIVPHAGVKLIQRAPHTQLLNLHVGFMANARGEFCIFFYESVTGICETKCFPSKEELKEALDEILEWLTELLKKVLIALGVAVLIVAVAVLAYLIAQAMVGALLILLAA